MPRNTEIIAQTKSWIEQIVIAQNFCPFASLPFKQDKIRYWIVSGDNPATHLEILVRELEHLIAYPEIDTSLLILPEALEDFYGYLDFFQLAVDLVEAQGYEGVFQLASFHPNYQFEGSEIDDPANFTNRSPYPILHILREEHVEKALESHPNPAGIPDKNIEHAQSLGASYFQNILNEIGT